MDECLDNCEYAVKGFAFWYDKIRRIDIPTLNNDAADVHTIKVKNGDDFLHYWKISSNILRAFECIGCWYNDIIPVLNLSSTLQLKKFYFKTACVNKTKPKNSKIDCGPVDKQGTALKAEKKTGGAHATQLQSNTKALKEDIKIVNTDGNVSAVSLAIGLADGDEPDSLDMNVLFGAFVGDNLEFFKIKTSNGVVKLADDGSVFTVNSRDSSTKSSNYGMSMTGHLELDGVGDVLLTVTVDEDLNDKLVAKISGNGVTDREVFDIIYDDNSPGAFRLFSNANDKYVASNDNGSLIADKDNEEDGQGMYENNKKKQRIYTYCIMMWGVDFVIIRKV